MNTTVIKRRLYLADLEVTAKDVYIKQDFANKTAETLDKSGQPQMGHNLYKTNLDTNKDTNKDTSMLDFSSTNFSQNVLQKQNQDIVANASEFLVSNGNSGKIPLEAENYIFGVMRNTFEVWYNEYVQSLSSNG